MKTVHVIGATLALSLAAAPAGAQTLAQLASPSTMLTLEMANFAQARQVAPGLFKDMAKVNLASGLGLSAAEKRQMADVFSLADKDALLAVSLDAKGNPHFLAAAKVSAAAGKTVTAMINDATASARQNHEIIQKVRAGSFGYTLTTTRGGDSTAFGFESGMVYVSDHAATLGDFLRNASGKGTNGSLGKQARYMNVMNAVGNGQLRLYVDLTPVAALGSELAGMAPEGLNLTPLVNAVAGFGQVGMRLRVTGAGVEAATSLAPAATRDPALANLLLGKPGAPLVAASVVPATAVSFSTSAVNMGGLYTYLNTLIDKTGLNPGGLDALAAQELGLDLRKNLINWMGGEIATAEFNVASKTSPLETVYFIRVTDPQAAQAGLEASVPVIAKALGQVLDTATTELGAATGGKGKVTVPPVTAVKATPGTIAGVSVTRWGNGSGAVITAFQNNFLVVATSEAGMTAALAGGPRLNAANAWTTTVARAPANATAVSMTNEAATLRAAATAMGAVGPALSAGLSAGLSGELGQGAGAYSATAMGFLDQIGGFVNALANRAGTSYGWTAVSNGRVTTTSIIPMRW